MPWGGSYHPINSRITPMTARARAFRLRQIAEEYSDDAALRGSALALAEEFDQLTDQQEAEGAPFGQPPRGWR